jgi:hypothetical protein
MTPNNPPEPTAILSDRSFASKHGWRQQFRFPGLRHIFGLAAVSTQAHSGHLS